MTTPTSDYLALLRTLTENQIDFIVVGGVCAVLHGAPVNTFDLDVVHSRAPDNLDRLLQVAQSLEAVYRGQGSRILRPTLSHLASPGHQLLQTRFGPLDLLGTIGHDLGYNELLARTTMLNVGEALQVRVLNLDALIAIKEQTARDRDRAMLPLLRRTLEEKSKAGE